MYLADKKTGRFWTARKKWASTMKAAHDFGRIIPARDYCKEHQLKDVELVLVFSGSNTAVRVDALVEDQLKAKGLDAAIGASLVFAGYSELSCGAAHWLGAVLGPWLRFAKHFT